MITIAKSNTPEELLETFKNKRDAKVVGNERKLLKEAKQIGLIDEVINVIIYNSLIVNDTTNLTENNFLKAVNDFSYKKINSAEDALNYFNNRKKSTGKKFNKNKPTKSNVPIWSNPDYKDDTTPEQQAKLEEKRRKLLEKIRKGSGSD